jgi:hypothetical protein
MPSLVRLSTRDSPVYLFLINCQFVLQQKFLEMLRFLNRDSLWFTTLEILKDSYSTRCYQILFKFNLFQHILSDGSDWPVFGGQPLQLGSGQGRHHRWLGGYRGTQIFTRSSQSQRTGKNEFLNLSPNLCKVIIVYNISKLIQSHFSHQV